MQMTLVRAEELLFEILFVMTEVVGSSGSAAFQKTLVIFWIDVAQVLRVMCSVNYGWSQESYDLVKQIDIVWHFGRLVSKAIPRYSLFILASFLVCLAIGDTAYAAKLFQNAAKVHTLWPIKLLRFLVSTVVTILFSSVLKWLLIPLECLTTPAIASLSSYLHGEDDLCSPWAFPDIIFSLFTIFSAVAYSSFAITVSSLAFETNLLARGSRSMSTGRVESVWIVGKVAATVLTYLCAPLRSVPCAVVVLLIMLFITYQHLTLLPFHRHETNVIRGGVFWAVTWLAVSTVIVAAGDTPQETQWWLLAFVVVFFLLGACFTHYLRVRIDRSIERLRAEFAIRQRGTDRSVEMSPRVEQSSSDGEAGLRAEGVKQSPLEKFYDPTWESRKAFKSERKAKVMLLTLLHRRLRDDIPLLSHLLDKALEEYPDSQGLRILEILVVRIIKQDYPRAAVLEKRYKMDRKALPIDYRYVLFALERTQLKQSAGANLGKGNFSVINVMEFDAGMEKARRAHMKCLSALKRFWAATRHYSRADRRTPMMDEMLRQMSIIDTAVDQANQEYKVLVELYGTSAPLLCTYSQFCETILNNPAEAEKWKLKAEALEKDADDVYPDDPLGPTAGTEDNKSQGSGVEDNVGSKGKKFEMWRDSLLQDERSSVLRLTKRVKVLLLLLLALSASLYVVMHELLLSEMAVHNFQSIDTALHFGVHAALSAFYLRGMHVGARTGDGALYEDSQAKILSYTQSVKNELKQLYETAPDGKVSDFYEKADVELYVPTIGGWSVRQHNYWAQANDWIRRTQRAATTSTTELQDDSFALDAISNEKRNIAYVMQNTLRYVIPTFDQELRLYLDEVGEFRKTAALITNIGVEANVVLFVFISCMVATTVVRVVPMMQAKRVGIIIALQLPPACQRRIADFYSQLEKKMLELEDEDDEEEKPHSELPAMSDWQAGAAMDEGDDKFIRSPSKRVPSPLPGVLKKRTDCSPNQLQLTESNLHMFEQTGVHADFVFPDVQPRVAATSSKHSSSPVFEIHSSKQLNTHHSNNHNGGNHTLAESTLDVATDTALALQAPVAIRSAPPHILSARSPQLNLQALGLQLDDLTSTPRRMPLLAPENVPCVTQYAEPHPHTEMNGVSGVSDHPRFSPGLQQSAHIKYRRLPLLTRTRPAGEETLALLDPLASDDHAEMSDITSDQHAEMSEIKVEGDVSSALHSEPEQLSVRGKEEEDTADARLVLGEILSHVITDDRPGGQETKSEEGQVSTTGVTSAFALRAGSLPPHAGTGLTPTPTPPPAADVTIMMMEPSKTDDDRLPTSAGFTSSGSPPEGDEVTLDPAHPGAEMSKDDGGEGEGEGAVDDGSGVGWGKVSSGNSKSSGHSQSLRARLSGDVRPAGEKMREIVVDLNSASSQVQDGNGERTVGDVVLGARQREGRTRHVPLQRQVTLPPMLPMSGARGTMARMEEEREECDSPSSLTHDALLARRGGGVKRGSALSEEIMMPMRPLRVGSQSDAQLTELDRHLISDLDNKVFLMRKWHSWYSTWFVVVSVLIGLCIFATLFPMRVLPSISDMAHIIHESGQRIVLTQSCAFLARELVINDGLSRAGRAELAHDLQGALSSFKQKHTAVRLGGALDITTGADQRFPKHNDLMYEDNCEWRQHDSSNAEETGGRNPVLRGEGCSIVGWEEAANRGLDHLVHTFFDSVEAIHDKYAPDEEWKPNTSPPSGFTTLVNSSQGIARAEHDPDMNFLLYNVDGDLFQGLSFIQQTLYDESEAMLDRALADTLIFFVLYIATLIFGWYLVFFNSVVDSAQKEARKSQDFVARLPTKVCMNAHF